MARRTPRKIASENELYAAAVGALARRAHSISEMRKYLERRAEEGTPVRGVLARLKDRGYLDDARYARQFARDRAANRRQGPFRIARELRARGVPDRHIDAALEELAGETDQRETLRRRIQSWLRRHSVADPAALDRKRTASLYHSLLRAGFPGEGIRAELRRLGQPSESLPEAASLETTGDE
jgi:regulatory protein